MTATAGGAHGLARGVLERRGRRFVVRPLTGDAVRLFLTSATILYVELLLIRWVPANVTYVGFFSNFLLMASFLGIGLGILLGRRGLHLHALPVALLLMALVILVNRFQIDLRVESDSELFLGLRGPSADTNYLVFPAVVVLVTGILASLALPLGPLLRSMRPLKAYAIDILGSMTGILAFTALSAAGTDPLAWFLVALALVVVLELGSGVGAWSLPALAALVASVVLVGSYLTPAGDAQQVYSPYYRITVYQDERGMTRLLVNGIPHQSLRPADQALWPIDDHGKEPFYEQVYRWFPGRTYDDVLVVGAGSGTDLAGALAHGAGRIDAVEIDPAIQRIGIERHPDHPYQDPRVSRFVNDGRAFLRGSDARYDLVVFALPDSLTLVSTTANLRLESFLFTEEAFRSVRDHLKPGGVFVLYNYYREPWLVAKLADMLATTFGHQPLIRRYEGAVASMAALAAGPAVAELGGRPPPGDRSDPTPAVGDPKPTPATDDWPFSYLRSPFVASYYLAALMAMLAFAALSVFLATRVTGTGFRRFSPHFFVLGVAFLLLETRSLVSFSLLFGTTWLVNALAFFAILASVLLAILINARFPIRRPWLLYLGLFTSLGMAYLMPPESLLIDPPWLRYALAAAVAFAPVFFANLVFSYSFRDTRSADMAFASNLLGAMVGGALEYLALLTGYRALLLLVAGLYGIAYLFATRLRFLADRDLEASSVAEAAPGAVGDGAREATTA
jgi:SAM-dependent methyltransferase